MAYVHSKGYARGTGDPNLDVLIGDGGVDMPSLYIQTDTNPQTIWKFDSSAPSGSRWIILSQANISTATTLPTFVAATYPIGYVLVIKDTGSRTGISAVYQSSGTAWVLLGSSRKKIEIPNTAFADKRLPLVSEVTTWVNANLDATEKLDSELYMIEDILDANGFGITGQSISITSTAGTHNIRLLSATINGNVYTINEDLEDTSNVVPLLLDYTGCTTAETEIKAGFTTEGITNSIVLINGNNSGTGLVIYIFTKAAASHNIFFTYTNDNSATTINTSTLTSSAQILTLGSTVNDPDHIWEITNSVITTIKNRVFHSNIIYVHGFSGFYNGQVGNPNRPFGSTTQYMLYAGVSVLPTNGLVQFINKAGSSTTQNIITGNGIKVVDIVTGANFFVYPDVSGRVYNMNIASGGSIQVSTRSASANGFTLTINGDLNYGASSVTTTYVDNYNSTPTKIININGNQVNPYIYGMGASIYNIKVNKIDSASVNLINLYDTSTLNLDCKEISTNIIGHETSVLNLRYDSLVDSILVNGSSKLNVNALNVGLITLNTDSDCNIKGLTTNSEIGIIKTSTTATRPVYNISIDKLDITSINNLSLNLLTDNINDFISSNRAGLQLFKSTSATTGIDNIEVNYTFKDVKNTSNLISWAAEWMNSVLTIKGNKYKTTTTGNLTFYQPTGSSTNNKIIIDCDIEALESISGSGFLLDPVDGTELISFNGKINAPLVGSLFVLTTADFTFNLSGQTKNADTLITNAYTTAAPKIIIKDLIYILTNLSTWVDIDNDGGAPPLDILVQNVASNAITDESVNTSANMSLVYRQLDFETFTIF